MIDWNRIDHVMLDMDGTLLDLNYDNRFWMHYIPEKFAEQGSMPARQAHQWLHQQYRETAGTLAWYSIDHWSSRLNLDIRSLSYDLKELICFRSGTEAFLNTLRDWGKDCWLVTNAHPHNIELKMAITGLDAYLDRMVNAHELSAPKESPLFWQRLSQHWTFDPSRTLMIDDNESVLAAASAAGIGFQLGIARPDSQQPARRNLSFPAIRHFRELTELKYD